jgi:hypothetical protein
MKIDDFTQFINIFINISTKRIFFLIAATVLLPLNILVESWKWKFLLRFFYPITLLRAIRDVLWGQTGAFITPNSVGEFPARAMTLPTEQRITAISMGFTGSIAQTAAVSFFGIIASPIFIFRNLMAENMQNLIIIIIIAVIVSISTVFLLLLLPKISIKMKNRDSASIKNLVAAFSKFSWRDSLKLIRISTLKYLIFSLQFYFVLLFCGVDLPIVEAITAIPTFYLMLTYIPIINAADAVVRSSIGVLVFGVFCADITVILTASIIFWVLNFVIPLIGGIICSKKAVA